MADNNDGAGPDSAAGEPVVVDTAAVAAQEASEMEAGALFGMGDAPSEADLMGEDDGAGDGDSDDSAGETDDSDSTGGDPPATPPEPTEEELKAAADAKEEEAKTAADAEDPEPGETTPPKGFVPLAAVKEVRSENSYLKSELATLKNQVLELKQAPPAPAAEPVIDPAAPPEFKYLTNDEFEDLQAEDPNEAISYMRQESAHKEQVASYVRAQSAQAEKDASTRTVIDAAYTEMEAAVPGLFEDNSEASQKFTEFAKELGFTPEMYSLTDPGTLILPVGAEAPQVMGNLASGMVKVLAGLQTKLSERGSQKETIRKELETTIRAEVQAELLQKFKTDGEAAFTSIATLQGTEKKVDAGKPDLSTVVLTDVEYGKLSPAEQQRYLSGGAA